jgi:hypothetical protein
MHFAIKCLVALTVFMAPCAYDTDPYETSAIPAMVHTIR